MQAEARNMDNSEGEKISIKEGLERLAATVGLETPLDLEIAKIRSRQVQETDSGGARSEVAEKSVTEVLVVCRGRGAADKMAGSGGRNIKDNLMEWAEELGEIDVYVVCKDSAEVIMFRSLLEKAKQNIKTQSPNLVWCALGTFKSIGKLDSGQSPDALLDQLGRFSLEKHKADEASGTMTCWPLADYPVGRNVDTETEPMKPIAQPRPDSLKVRAVLGGILVLSWVGMFCALVALLAVRDSSPIIFFGAFALVGWVVLNFGPSATADEQ